MIRINRSRTSQRGETISVMNSVGSVTLPVLVLAPAAVTHLLRAVATRADLQLRFEELCCIPPTLMRVQ